MKDVASLKGKGLRLTLEVYRVLKSAEGPLNIYRIWRGLVRNNLPSISSTGRRVHKLEEEGYLRVDHTETRPRGMIVPFYLPTAKFDLAVEEQVWTRPVALIPRDLVAAAKEFLKTDSARAMGLFTVCDVVNAATRELLRDHGLYVPEPQVVRDHVDRVLERSDRR